MRTGRRRCGTTAGVFCFRWRARASSRWRRRPRLGGFRRSISRCRISRARRGGRTRRCRPGCGTWSCRRSSVRVPIRAAKAAGVAPGVVLGAGDRPLGAPGLGPRPGSPARITGQDHRPGSAKALAESLEASAWTTVTWREGSNAPPRLPPSRDALHRGLGLPDLRTADDSPSGPPAAAGRKAPSVPEGYRPRGAADPARTAQPDLDRHSAAAPRGGHRKGPPAMSRLQRAETEEKPIKPLVTQ